MGGSLVLFVLSLYFILHLHLSYIFDLHSVKWGRGIHQKYFFALDPILLIFCLDILIVILWCDKN